MKAKVHKSGNLKNSPNLKCWHYDTGVVLDGNSLRWQFTMQQVTNKGLHIRLQRMKKERYTLVHFVQQVYTHGLTEQNERITYTCTFTIRNEHTCWKTKFLVQGIFDLFWWLWCLYSFSLVIGKWFFIFSMQGSWFYWLKHSKSCSNWFIFVNY